jgi:transcriptional antiterminator RfaH
MPILPAEPELYPPDLWTRPGGPSMDRPWWCLHTRPRQEKAVARALRELGLTFYLPLVLQETRTPAGRRLRSCVPLFGGYVFLQGDDAARREALATHRLAQALPVPDPATLVADLTQVARMLRSGEPVVPEPTHPAGTRVRIATGPLTGLVGVVLRRGAGDRFVAVVRLLGIGAAIDLRDWQVEPAGP